MKLTWTAKALSDLERLHRFLASVDASAAARTIQRLVAAPSGLQANPRLGLRLDAFRPREVRRILVGNYELRYEIAGGAIIVLRVWHTREDR